MELLAFNQAYVQRLIDGDPETAGHFTAYFSTLLLLKLRRHVHSPQEMADLRQETFLRVLTALRRGGLEHPGSLGAFVCKTCDLILLERARAMKGFGPAGDSAPEPIDERISLEGELIDRERNRQVAGVLAELAPKDRKLLRLIFFEELDTQEVGRRLHVSPEYVRVLLHRAKTRFRSKYRAKGPGFETKSPDG